MDIITYLFHPQEKKDHYLKVERAESAAERKVRADFQHATECHWVADIFPKSSSPGFVLSSVSSSWPAWRKKITASCLGVNNRLIFDGWGFFPLINYSKVIMQWMYYWWCSIAAPSPFCGGTVPFGQVQERLHALSWDCHGWWMDNSHSVEKKRDI